MLGNDLDKQHKHSPCANDMNCGVVASTLVNIVTWLKRRRALTPLGTLPFSSPRSLKGYRSRKVLETSDEVVASRP
eukprot:963673-Heterocapsa_arctica.AAC.1